MEYNVGCKLLLQFFCMEELQSGKMLGFIVRNIGSDTKEQDTATKAETLISLVELRTHTDAHIPTVT